MNTHTKGPWKTGGVGDDGWRMVIGPETRWKTLYGQLHTTEVALVSSSDNEEEDLANARLIAAAPDLLEALEAFVGNDPTWMSGDSRFVAARLAIAKAKGTTS